MFVFLFISLCSVGLVWLITPFSPVWVCLKMWVYLMISVTSPSSQLWRSLLLYYIGILFDMVSSSVQFSSVWHPIPVSWEICTPLCLSEVSPMLLLLVLKQFLCWSDWQWTRLVLSRQIVHCCLSVRLTHPQGWLEENVNVFHDDRLYWVSLSCF